jgi:hypothetical protein
MNSILHQPALAGLTAPDAHLTAAGVTFTTHDDDKDFDTFVRVEVVRPHVGEDPNRERIAAEGSDFGTQYTDNSVHTFGLHADTGFVARSLAFRPFVRISIQPNGHDTWRFSYELTLDFTDGTSFVIQDGNLSLSETNTVLITPFTFTSQVAVPDVVGDSQSGAQSVLQAAGLTVGTVRHSVDHSCNFIGQVSDQNPGAGTIVNTGTAVDLTIGDRPNHPCP